MTIGIRVAVLLGLLANTAGAVENRLRHLPPAEATPDRDLELEASVDHASDMTVELRYRRAGTQAWQRAEFRRQRTTSYVVSIPAAAVQPPGVEYYIVTRAGTREQTRFASSRDPHRVSVFFTKDKVRQEQELQRYRGKRAQVRVRGELVDFGTRELGLSGMKVRVPDRYLRIDADLSYRVLRFPLHSLRFGYTRLVGEVPESSRGDDRSCDGVTSAEMCTFDAGFKVGGWFEIDLQPVEGFHLDARGMVMATSEGFNVGGRGEVRFGYAEGSHVALAFEHVADTGTTGAFRLGWDTVPKLPMTATVEVTNLPATHRATAVRLLYDIYHHFDAGLMVGLRAGYQARDQLIGGVSGGFTMALDF